jgi:prefoldin subunit 5
VDPLIDELAASVDVLIRENQALKKQIARLEADSTKARTPEAQTLKVLHRRLSQALNGAETAKVAAPQKPAPSRRRITDPEILEKRREALAKARQALAEKRAAERSASQQTD